MNAINPMNAPWLRSLVVAVLVVSTLLTLPQPANASPYQTMSIAALPLISNFMKGQRPATLGVKAGALAPCPQSPNCVVSQGQEDSEHAIAPIAYTSDQATAMAQLVEIVKAMPRTAIVQQTDDYLYAEFTSQLMGFVDDVEFYLPASMPVIHVRSASRLGESDLGVNRQRIEAIRSQLAPLAAEPSQD
jgi:uncharacterized protein (DUF1499 family)